jgi:hypothetical protein
MSPRILTMDELPDLVGSTFTIDRFRVGQDEINTFEDVTGVTAVYEGSLATDYPDGMIEGFHSLSLCDYLMHQLIRVDPAESYAYNYGLDRVRFPSSLTTEDELSFTVAIAEATPRNGGYLMRYRCTIAAVGAAKPGMVADWLGLCLPRSSTDFKPPREKSTINPTPRNEGVTS